MVWVNKILTSDIDYKDGAIVNILLSNPSISRERCKFVCTNAMIDTGAERTIISDGIPKYLRLKPVENIALDLPGHRVKSVIVEIRFEIIIDFGKGTSYKIERLPVLSSPMGRHEDCLIGRDILRYGILTYNGRRQKFSLRF